MQTKRASLLDTRFYLLMSILILVVVVLGFSRTIDTNLIHPAVPRPTILHMHVAIFLGWVILLILQSALIRTRNVGLHKLVGWYGVVHGIAVPAIGIPTTIVMGRFHVAHHDGEPIATLLIPFWDMVAFSVPFVLAVLWRKKPEFHRRLMLMATCALTAAAFGRFPPQIFPPALFYLGVDLLIVFGIVRDWIVNRQVHRVYKIGLPLLVVGQTIVMYLVATELPGWVRMAQRILG